MVLLMHVHPHPVVKQIRHLEAKTCHIDTAYCRSIPTHKLLARSYSYRLWVRRTWQRALQSVEYVPPTTTAPQPTPQPSSSLYADFLCIHSHEGAWNDNTGNGYYGGLQMDYSFMQTYGPEFLASYGTADKWPIADQILAAERAYATRGFTPWPNTAAMCGLL